MAMPLPLLGRALLARLNGQRVTLRESPSFFVFVSLAPKYHFSKKASGRVVRGGGKHKQREDKTCWLVWSVPAASFRLLETGPSQTADKNKRNEMQRGKAKFHVMPVFKVDPAVLMTLSIKSRGSSSPTFLFVHLDRRLGQDPPSAWYSFTQAGTSFDDPSSKPVVVYRSRVRSNTPTLSCTHCRPRL